MGPQTLLFTIQSLLRLGEAARSSYLESVHDREFTLPLLDFKISRNDTGVITYFHYYTHQKDDPTELTALLQRLEDEYNSPAGIVSQDVKDDLYSWYQQTDEYKDDVKGHIVDKTKYKESDLSAQTLVNLFTIRQNSLSGSPHLSVFQRMAGTFLEIGIDYFNQVQGSLNVNSRSGLGLQALFTALDDVRFSETQWKADLGELPRRFTVSLLETIEEKADIFTHDSNVQQLIQQTAQGLTADVSAYFEQSDHSADNKVAISLAETLFRSIIKHAGTAVSNDPATFLGIDDTAQANLVKDLTGTLFSMVLESPVGNMPAAFNRQALDRLVKTAIGTISRYPQLVTGSSSQGVQAVISAVSKELMKPSYALDGSLIPEIARLILEKSNENMELLWPDSSTDAKAHVLMQASKTLLSRLVNKPAAGSSWHLQLNKDDLKAVMDTALGEVAANPAWLVKKAGQESTYLAAALDSMLTVINQTGANRINSQNGARLIQAGLRGAAMRLEFLHKPQGEKRILERLFSVVLTKLLSDDPAESATAWQFAKGDMLAQIMEAIIQQLSRAEVSESSLAQIKALFDEEITLVQAGQAWDLQGFSKKLQQTLQSLS